MYSGLNLLYLLIQHPVYHNFFILINCYFVCVNQEISSDIDPHVNIFMEFLMIFRQFCVDTVFSGKFPRVVFLGFHSPEFSERLAPCQVAFSVVRDGIGTCGRSLFTPSRPTSLSLFFFSNSLNLAKSSVCDLNANSMEPTVFSVFRTDGPEQAIYLFLPRFLFLERSFIGV